MSNKVFQQGFLPVGPSKDGCFSKCSFLSTDLDARRREATVSARKRAAIGSLAFAFNLSCPWHQLTLHSQLRKARRRIEPQNVSFDYRLVRLRLVGRF